MMAAFAVLVAILVLVAVFFSRSNKRGGCKSACRSRCTDQYAVLSNQAAVTTGGAVLWAASDPTSISSGIVLNSGTGTVTLPRGTFLVQYTVRFTRAPFDGTATATAQLQQTAAGVLANIGQPAIVNDTATDGITDAIPSTPILITGNAIINVTSSSNDMIALFVVPADNNAPTVATGTDANAQLTIHQL